MCFPPSFDRHKLSPVVDFMGAGQVTLQRRCVDFSNRTAAGQRDCTVPDEQFAQPRQVLRHPLQALQPSCRFWVANRGIFIWCRIFWIRLVGRLTHRRPPIPSWRLHRWFFRVVGRLVPRCLAFAIDLRLGSSVWFDRHKLFRAIDFVGGRRLDSVTPSDVGDPLTADRASSLPGRSGCKDGSRTRD
jgi:hypothetical protein